MHHNFTCHGPRRPRSLYSRSVEVASAPAVSEASPPAGTASSVAPKREKAKLVAKGDATSYMAAVPSMAPAVQRRSFRTHY